MTNMSLDSTDDEVGDTDSVESADLFTLFWAKRYPAGFQRFRGTVVEMVKLCSI